MSFNLEKNTERAKFVLQKRGTPNIRAQVVTMLDVSGSARGLFTSGVMQLAWETTMGVANVLDINSEIDVYTFANDVEYVTHIQPTATIQNFENYIKKNIIDDKKVPKWGGTDYAPVIEQALEDFGFYKNDSVATESKGFFGFGKKKEIVTDKILQSKAESGEPVLCYFFTDGVNSDQHEIDQLFAKMEKVKTQFYVLFIGVGGASFPFIEKLGDRYSNIGFTSAKDLAKFSNNEDLYDDLIPQELTEWFVKI